MSTWLHLAALGLISAVSPTSLVPAIALLGSRNGPRAVAAYFLGSLASYAVVAGAVAGGVVATSGGSSGGVTTARAVFELAAGVASIVFAARFWLRRDAVQPRESQPGWLRFFDRLGLVGSFLFGAFWINAVLAVDAGLEIARASFGPRETTAAVLLYALVAASTSLMVLGVYFADRERADERLAAARDWSVRNGNAALAILLFALGALLVSKGAFALAS